jgi:hypothetical protein
MTALTAWENFYVIVGSSAGALIGLQFVVITLISELQIAGVAQASSAFGTPTIVPPMWAAPCLASERQCRCCSSSAFITPGTASHTTSLSDGQNTKLGSAVE